MNFKKFIIYLAAIILLTIVGLYFSVTGSVLYEGSTHKEIFSTIGNIFLWPYWIWSLIAEYVYTEKFYFSYMSLFLSQIIGYFFVIFILIKLRKNYNHNRSLKKQD